MSYKIDVNEPTELLLQSLPDSYDRLIIYLTNNILPNSQLFEEVATTVLEKEHKLKNKEDILVNSQQVEALIIMRGRPTHPVGAKITIDPRQGARRILNAIIVARKGSSRMIVAAIKRM